MRHRQSEHADTVAASSRFVIANRHSASRASSSTSFPSSSMITSPAAIPRRYPPPGGPRPQPVPRPGRAPPTPLGSGLVLALTIAEGRLEPAERPVPEPGAGEVLVRVAGAGLNRADLLQRAGRYPAPAGAPPHVPGLELAGGG